jgi:2-keto-4-pentenoate hydratase
MKPPSRIADAARVLFEAHERRERFSALPAGIAPRSTEEAYAIQDAFVALRAKSRGPVTGYKIALSTEAMRKFVGVNEPQAGMMHESTLRQSPARLRAADYVNLVIEFEIGVRMAADLPAADRPYFRERVAKAVGAVMPAIEVADDRGADYKDLPKHPLHLIADNTWNEGAVFGAPLEDWSTLDLGAVRATALINGQPVGEGVGAAAMGHPFDAVAWVADNLASRGRGLLRGDVVITGSLITTKAVKAGDKVEFRLEGFRPVLLSVE